MNVQQTIVQTTKQKATLKQKICQVSLGLSLLTMMTFQSAPAMAADDWKELDVRGLTPEMTFGEVKAHLEKNWPQARMKVRHSQLRHANSRFKYVNSINISDYSKTSRESFFITFLSPKNLTDDPKKLRIKKIVRNQDINNTPATREDFIKQVSSKYGEPTIKKHTKLHWIFDKKRKLLKIEKISAQKKAIELRCANLSHTIKNYINATMTTGQAPKDYKEQLDKLSRQQKSCYRDLSLIQRCLNRADSKFCPYRMTISWSEHAQTKGFVPAYVINLHNNEFLALDRQRQADLKQQLKNRALAETKAKAGAKLKL